MEKTNYELTNPQKAIWLIQQFHENSTINSIAGYLHIHTKCDIEKLEHAFNLFVKNNDAFRLRILNTEYGVKQYFAEYKYEKIPCTYLETEEEIESLSEEFVKEPLNVLNTKMFNVKFLCLKNGDVVILLNLHHLISDAWTMIFCLNEVYNNYVELLSGKKEEEFEENPSYSEFIISQNDYLNSDVHEKDKLYWEEKFEDLPDYISFKKDTNSGIVSNRKEFVIEESIMQKISSLCSEYKLSSYVFFLSIYTIYFKNMFNSDRYSIGNPVLNRSNFRQKHTAGMFVSTEPFVVEFGQAKTFLEHAQNIAKEQLTMYRHIKYPYDEIYEYVKKKHQTNNKLFDVVFSYQNAKISQINEAQPISAKWFQNYNQIESLMVHMKDTENVGSLTIYYDYLVNALTEEEIRKMHEGILQMLSQVTQNINIPLSNLEVISEKEKNILINELNNTYEKVEKSKNLVEEFEKIVKKYPDNIAVSCGNQKVTYRELNSRANSLAKKIYNLGANSDIIAFEMSRSVDIIVAIWAILKSGNTYMPIDPDYPDDRKQVMLKSSGAKLLITQNELKDKIDFNGTKIIVDSSELEDNLNIKIPSNRKTYIMYTSGSTGTPKAVTIRDENVLNFVQSMQEKLDYTPNENNKVLSVTTVCFDIFVFEHFVTILSGLELVIAKENETKSPKLLNEVILKNKISKILTTPSRIELLFMDNEYLECLTCLKEIILGGEPFPKQLLQDLSKITKARIFNLYGPTETTVYSTFKELTGLTEITIGKPIANTSIYLWNEENRLVPYGAIGEIVIGGFGVGDGYYNNPEQTSKVFVENPYKKGDIVYKTGDYGRWNEFGELICLGRKDYQVKIRGYRIELEDISNNILTFPGIEKAVVTDRENSNKRKFLCAYYVSNKNINHIELKKYLSEKLPNYMIPTHFMKLDELPLTINHKINRKLLPVPEETVTSQEEVKPVSNVQKILCKTISEELNIDDLGITHDLFDFGIDSLDIIRIQTKLLPYKFKINTQDFYECRTIENLSKKIEEEKKSEITLDDNIEGIQKCMNIEEEILNKVDYKCVLLTGVTGYLGMQILHDIIDIHDNCKIICLGRSKNEKTAKQRVEELYAFYFNTQINFKNIIVIDTDVTKPNLGLSEEDYNIVCKEVDLVINCAANVRYYGDYSYFKKVNVDITQNLIDFCKAKNVLFAHISTLGVSGNYLVSHKDETNTFDENDFYIGQNYKQNVYVQTKFEAERRIYENVQDGLKAVVFRVGNLTGRYSDGHFQKNIEENAFYHILLLLLKYKMVPVTMLTQMLEFTPVDLCSKAILQLLWNTTRAQRIYHIFNENYIVLSELINIFKELGETVEIETVENFEKVINNSIKNDSQILKGVVNDLSSNEGLSFKLTIDQKNTITNKYLSSLNFYWPKIDKKYIKKVLDYMKQKEK